LTSINFLLQEPRVQSSAKTRILIAEDDHDLRTTLRVALESEGYEVEAVPDGQKAIHAQEARPADLLITDLFMPDRDGLETVEYFRAHNPGMPIVAISGWNSQQHADHLSVAEVAGANAVFRKPFRMGELLEQLRSLTSQK
jgi:DNA-binding response OmpR family regulator